MYEYFTPSIATYHKRKLFHSNERHQSETTEEWFYRVFESLDGCEFQELADFMLIDKFIAGLEYESFQKCAKKTTLSVAEVLPITTQGETISLGKNSTNSFDTALVIETSPDVDDLLAEEDIKLEDYDSDAQSVPEVSDLKSNNKIIVSDFKSKVNHRRDNDASTDDNIKVRNVDGDIENVFTERPKKIKGFKRDKNRNIICLDCGKQFKHKNSYNYHKKIHTGSGLYYCMICAKRFVKEIQLKMHMPTHDHENKSLECYLCSSKFDRLHGLRIHFTHSHIGRTKCHLQCSMCNRTFSKQKDFDLHINVHRGLVKGHKCQHCDKTFDKRSTLKEHIVVHLNTCEFVCETCGRAFKCKNTLKKHSHVHNSNRSFKCCECGQVLKSTATLKNHMRQHTGERPYSCDLCSKSFVTSPSLIKHLRVHRQERPHGCTVCPKRFATTYHLKLHMHTHTGAKPYECDQCDKAFTQLGTLKAHQLKVHPK